MTSTPRLIANRASWKSAWKRTKIETMALLLKGALEAESKVGYVTFDSSRPHDVVAYGGDEEKSELAAKLERAKAAAPTRLRNWSVCGRR